MDCSPPGSRSNAEEAEVERFYEDLQDLLELTPPPQKKVLLTQMLLVKGSHTAKADISGESYQ